MRRRAGISWLIIVTIVCGISCSIKKPELSERAEQFAATAKHEISIDGLNSANGGLGQNANNSNQTDSPEDDRYGSSTSTGVPTSTPTCTPTPTGTSTPTPTPTSTPSPSPIPIPDEYAKDGKLNEIPSFSGKSFVIMDGTSGEVVLSHRANERIYPASTIKLLTALTALDYADMKNEITADAEVLSNVAEDATQFGVTAGTTYPLEVWMNMLLISSFGDAADTIAAGTAGSTKQFVNLMNLKAKQLGMSSTHVDNAIGLDIGNEFNEMYSTAADIARLSFTAMKNSAIASIVAKKSFTVPASADREERVIESTNYYYTKSDLYHSDYFTAIGTKSGMTEAAGYCYVSTVVNSAGQKYICCFFGFPQKSLLFQEMTAMLEYCYKRFE